MTADLLKLIAPGTPIRDGLENILRAKTGALLLITDNNDVIKEIVDGGFYINEEYTSSKLYELAKMDGAIVLSGDLKRILFANAQLIPSREIETRETGTRHRTAERTAKQTGELVISISQRRNIIATLGDAVVKFNEYRNLTKQERTDRMIESLQLIDLAMERLIDKFKEK